jgi:hypothetical protein
MKNFKYTLGLLLAGVFSLQLHAETFTCPASSVIAAIPLSIPGVSLPSAFWVGPAVSGYFPGFGFGGVQVGSLIGSQQVIVGNTLGYLCVYNASQHATMPELRKQNVQLPAKLDGLADIVKNSQDTTIGYLEYVPQQQK